MTEKQFDILIERATYGVLLFMVGLLAVVVTCGVL